ncbi:MAG TPA: WD40 repeat domain-containing protein [Gemmataceae bacterium]|nr:WD40 repeat domain-containing protein [Gemmataceae bacterium]
MLFGTALTSGWLLESGAQGAIPSLAPDVIAKAALSIATGKASLVSHLPAWRADLAKGATKTMFVRKILIAAAIASGLGLGTAGVVMGLPGESSEQAQSAPLERAPVEVGASQPAQETPPRTRTQTASAQPESIQLAGHKGTVHCVAISPDGKVIATGGADGTVRVWDAATGKATRKFDLMGEAVSVAFSPDGKSVGTACAGKGGAIRVFDVANGKESLRFEGIGRGGGGLAFSRDGQRIVAGFTGGIAEMIDATSGRIFSRHRFNNGGATIAAAAFSLDGKLVALGDAGGQVHLIDSATGRALMNLGKGNGPVTALAFLPDGKRGAMADGGQGLRTWDVATSKEERAFDGKDPIKTLALSKDGKLVVTAGASGEIRLWDVASGKEERSFVAPNAVNAVAMDHDGKRLVTVGQAGSVIVWDLTRDEKPLPKNFKLTEEALTSSWADLKSDEAGKAYAALRMLQADPARSVPFLRERLKPRAERPDEKQIKQLIADLDADEFATREKASKDLEKLGKLAEATMREALAAGPSLEAKKRLERLLGLLGDDRPLTADQQRDVRAIRVLEQTGTSEARKLLESLTKESPGWWVTQEARIALQRLELRDKK